jgi:peptide/nickel transport system substrate-binding protein
VPVTADDAAYAFEAIKQLGHIYQNYDAGGVPDLVRELKVLNAHQFEIRTTRPVNPVWFELNGLNGIIPLPRHVWKNMSTDEMWRRQSDPTLFAVGDGPYRLERMVLSRYISLVRNPRFGGKPGTVPRIVIDFLQGADAFQAFSSGEVDASDLPFALVDKARLLPGVAVIATHPAFLYLTLTLNYGNDDAAFFRDVRVRQAMADAIDQAGMVRVIFHGFGTPLHGAVPPLPPTFLSPDARAGRFPVGYDPGRARALLAASGFTPGADGMLQKNGRRLGFTALLSIGGTSGPQIAQFIQRDFAAVGIDMRIKQMEFNQMLALAFGPKQGWQAEFISWTIEGFPDGQQNFSSRGSENMGHYSDPTMDRLVDAVNFSGGTQALDAWQDYTAAQQPVIFFSDGYIPVIVRAGIAGARDMINPDGALYPEELTITDPNFCHAAHNRRAP